MERGNAFALLDHLSGAIAGPDPHNQVEVIGLDSERQYLPALLSTLALQQLTTPRRDWPNEYRLPAARTPDEVIDDEMDAVFISLVLVCLFHGLSSTTE